VVLDKDGRQDKASRDSPCRGPARLVAVCDGAHDVSLGVHRVPTVSSGERLHYDVVRGRWDRSSG
jgi:hypothetical protein